MHTHEREEKCCCHTLECHKAGIACTACTSFFSFVKINITNHGVTVNLTQKKSTVTPNITVRRGQKYGLLLYNHTQQWYSAHCTTMNHFWGVKSNSGLSSWQRKLDSHAVFHHFVIWKALLLPRGLKGKKKKQATVDNVTKKRSSFLCINAVELLHTVQSLLLRSCVSPIGNHALVDIQWAWLAFLALQQNSFTLLSRCLLL